MHVWAEGRWPHKDAGTTVPGTMARRGAGRTDSHARNDETDTAYLVESSPRLAGQMPMPTPISVIWGRTSQ